MDDFVILDIAYSNKNNNVVSYMTTASDVDSVIWHTRLGHIGQDRINRLGRDSLLGQIAKINLSTCEHCLAGKSIGNLLEKPHEHLFLCSWYTLTSMAQ